jgi:hypothetical protein
MMEYVVIGILFLVMVYQGVMQYLWYKNKTKEVQDLLDRIMSTDYSQYAAIRVSTKAQESQRVVPLEELAAHFQANEGIPL